MWGIMEIQNVGSKFLLSVCSPDLIFLLFLHLNTVPQKKKLGNYYRDSSLGIWNKENMTVELFNFMVKYYCGHSKKVKDSQMQYIHLCSELYKL